MTINEICPNLGKRDDPATPISYPSASNRCYKEDAALRPSQDHQQQYCLCSAHTTCPIYQRGAANVGSSAVEPAGDDREPDMPPQQRPWVLWTGILLTGVIAVAAFLAQGSLSAAQQETAAQVTVTDGFKPVAAESATPESTPTEKVLQAATATEAPVQTLTPNGVKLEADTPFGGEIKFVVHIVAAGESFGQLAADNKTNLLLIQKVNGPAFASAAVGSAIIIPRNQDTLPEGTPTFTAYQVPERITLRDLAAQLGAALNEMAIYNGLNEAETLEADSWVLVPAAK